MLLVSNLILLHFSLKFFVHCKSLDTKPSNEKSFSYIFVSNESVLVWQNVKHMKKATVWLSILSFRTGEDFHLYS